jgi:hypothetical protein
MDDRLDRLLAQLRAAPLDRNLEGVEGDVNRHLARRAHPVGLGFAPGRAAAVGLALILGTGVGGLTAAAAVAAPRVSIFAATDALAPSALLEGPR